MGLRPVAEMQFIDFISCAYDMLTNYVATARYRAGLPTPMVVRGPCGGYVRGGPFHSQNPEAAFLHTPGLKIVCPATARDAKGLIKAAIRDDDPVLYFEHKALYRRLKGEQPDPSHRTPIGRAHVARAGTRATVVTYAAGVDLALRAAEGLDAEVLDLRTVWPFDREAVLESVARTSRLLVLQEASRSSGVAGQVLSLVAREAFEHLDAPPVLVAPPDTPVPFAPELEDAYIPSVESVRRALEELLAY
jgi:2-oxoisovalerate dehydrogenase E1 component beta subunit